MLVRRSTAKGFRPPREVNFDALLRPFSRDTWLLLASAVGACAAVTAGLAVGVPTPVWRRRSAWLRALQWLSNLYVGGGGGREGGGGGGGRSGRWGGEWRPALRARQTGALTFVARPS